LKCGTWRLEARGKRIKGKAVDLRSKAVKRLKIRGYQGF